MKQVLLMLTLTMVHYSGLIADITWSSPSTQISTSGVNASNPQIGIDLNGNVVAVWVENSLVKTKNLPFGGSWSAIQTLSASGGSNPQLTVDPSGNATAIWLEAGVVKASSRPFGGSWSAKVSISASGSTQPHLAVDTSGNAVAVWENGGYIQSSTKMFGGSWNLVILVDTIGDRISDSPKVAIGANGQVIVVWHSVVSSVDTILSNSKMLGGLWGLLATTISSSGQDSINPRVAVDASGNAIATWFRFDVSGAAYSNVIFQSASKPSAGAWTTPVDISDAGIYNPSRLSSSLAIDGNGIAIAAWNTSHDGATLNYEAAVHPLNGTWGFPIDIIDLNLYAHSSNVAIDTLGHSQLIYMLDQSGSLNIEVVELDVFAQTLAQTSFASLSTGAQNGFPKVTTSTSSGTIYTGAVWISNDGSNNVIHASTGSGAVYPAPTSLAVNQSSNNFNVLTEYYNTLSWTASTNPNTTSYLIYRNGINIGQVDSFTTSYLDHNQIQNGSVTYGVAALDDNFAQSTISTVSYP